MENYCESIDYYQKPCHAPKPTTMDEPNKDDSKGKGKAVAVAVADLHAGAADQEQPESQEEFFSDSESIEIADLKKRQTHVEGQLLLMKLEGRSAGRDRAGHDGEAQLQLQPGTDDHSASAAAARCPGPADQQGSAGVAREPVPPQGDAPGAGRRQYSFPNGRHWHYTALALHGTALSGTVSLPCHAV